MNDYTVWLTHPSGAQECVLSTPSLPAARMECHERMRFQSLKWAAVFDGHLHAVWVQRDRDYGHEVL